MIFHVIFHRFACMSICWKLGTFTEKVWPNWKGHWHDKQSLNSPFRGVTCLWLSQTWSVVLETCWCIFAFNNSLKRLCQSPRWPRYLHRHKLVQMSSVCVVCCRVVVTQLTVDTDSWHEVLVSHIEDPEHVYCQPLASADALNTLMERIDSYVAENQRQQLSQPPVLGSFILAKYSADQGWYRATVTVKPHLTTSLFHINNNSNKLAGYCFKFEKVNQCQCQKIRIFLTCPSS